MAGEPLPDLTGLVKAVEGEDGVRGLIKKAHKAAWNEWRDSTLGDRFSQKKHPNSLGFSQRSARYMRRNAAASAAARLRAQQRGTTAVNYNKGKTKGDLPDYEYTGQGKAQVYKKKASSKKGKDPYVKTSRSISFSALSLIKDFRGWAVQREVKSSAFVTRPAHTRTMNGRSFVVRSYKQRAYVWKFSGTESAKTYGQEWSFSQSEVDKVAKRADELLYEMTRVIGYTKGGKLKDKYRAEINRRANLEGA